MPGLWPLWTKCSIYRSGFLELWDVANDPAQDCVRGDADAEFPGHLPVTKLKAQIPPYTGDDNVVGEPT